jgi:transglutaminase-like putative cysteine protease
MKASAGENRLATSNRHQLTGLMYRRVPALAKGTMKIRLGYEIAYAMPRPTPMIFTLNVHYSRVSDLLSPDVMRFSPSVETRSHRDGFGNWCTRIVAPPGQLVVSADAVIRDTGEPDRVATSARQVPVELLPEETLVFLLGSRYCETDRLSEVAWQRFARTPTGWQRVQAICDFVHQHIKFGHVYANPTKTAWDVYQDRVGVCRDYAHLGVALCRCMNIPARYCTGYLGDIGIPVDGAMDFSGWFEAFLEGGWYTFDPRNNVPRIGRVLIARGRDAADVAISTTFGENTLQGFRVWTDEVTDIPKA